MKNKKVLRNTDTKYDFLKHKYKRIEFNPSKEPPRNQIFVENL